MYKSVVLPLNERKNENFAEHAPLYARENREGYMFEMRDLLPIGPVQRQIIPHGTPECGIRGDKLTLPCAWAIIDEQDKIVAVAFSSDTLHPKPSLYMTDPNNPQSVPEILQTRIGELQKLHEALVATPKEDLPRIELGSWRNRASFQQAFANAADHPELAFEWSAPGITMQDTMGNRVLNQMIDLIANKAKSAQTIGFVDVMREAFAKSYCYTPGQDFVEAVSKAAMIGLLELHGVASTHDNALLSKLCHDVRDIAKMTQTAVQNKQMDALRTEGIQLPEKFQAVFKQSFLDGMAKITADGLHCSKEEFNFAVMTAATEAGRTAFLQGYNDVSAEWVNLALQMKQRNEVLGTNTVESQQRNIALHKDREDYGDPDYDGQSTPNLDEQDGYDGPTGR